MTFEEWVKTVPAEITSDTLWRMQVYQQALFVGELAGYDACKLAGVRQTLAVSDQLYRATGGLSTNIAEGYSKASGKDQARFYEYALGSAREARDWYYKARHVLGQAVALHRMRLLVQIARQLLSIVPQQRGHRMKEEVAAYDVVSLNDLLTLVPMPTPVENFHTSNT